MLRTRRLVQKLFGYDPEVDNVDQKPFYRNNAGSKQESTLEWSGTVGVTLHELHAHTRQRWTCNTYCTSSSSRARLIPPLEVLFKGLRPIPIASCVMFVYLRILCVARVLNTEAR